MAEAARPQPSSMPDTFVRTRCIACDKVLSFDDFSLGGSRCRQCLKIVKRKPSPAYAPAPRTAAPQQPAHAPDVEDYERMLDSVPDELIDELVAALEAEAARLPVTERSPMREVFDDIGLGKTTREKQWAAWGFAAGFAANVAIAKYAQMATGAPFSQFFGPLVLGGVLAGLCCSAIGWGVAKLREPA